MFFLTLVVVFLQACSATPYQKQKSIYSGGYTETQLDENVFRVSFDGNEYTGADRVADFTLLRSADLTLQHGYSYFVVIDANSYSNYSAFTMPTTSHTTASAHGFGNSAYGSATTTTTGGQTFLVSKPSSTNTIVCFKEKPKNVFSYNAKFIYKNINEKYDIKISQGN
jgi:hypothetical protein